MRAALGVEQALSPVTCHLSPVTCHLSPVTVLLRLSGLKADG